MKIAPTIQTEAGETVYQIIFEEPTPEVVEVPDSVTLFAMQALRKFRANMPDSQYPTPRTDLYI